MSVDWCHIMTGSDAISYLQQHGWSSTKLGLSRTAALLHALGDPQKRLNFVHVAGSNGKGSTCAMLASVLHQAGYCTGLYISPHLVAFHERIQVNGVPISGEALGEITAHVKKHADAMPDHPSQFELTTAVALEYFFRSRCDIVVLEVGLGGALDATNVIDAPEAAVITNIGLEHTEYLGHSLTEIAAAKAGIIKPGCNVICYNGNPSVTTVIQSVCQKRGASFSLVDFNTVQFVRQDEQGQHIRWHGLSLVLPLLGRYQLRNAAVALDTVLALRHRGWKVGDDAIAAGLAQTVWPARLEILCRRPLILVDGGHNPQGAETLAESFESGFVEKRFVFLMGVLADKDYPQMLHAIRPFAETLLAVAPDNPRALPAEALAAAWRRMGGNAAPFPDLSTAVLAALKSAASGSNICVFGSLYLAGQARRLLLNSIHANGWK